MDFSAKFFKPHEVLSGFQLQKLCQDSSCDPEPFKLAACPWNPHYRHISSSYDETFSELKLS